MRESGDMLGVYLSFPCHIGGRTPATDMDERTAAHNKPLEYTCRRVSGGTAVAIVGNQITSSRMLFKGGGRGRGMGGGREGGGGEEMR